MRGFILDSPNSSRISRPSKVSPPTIPTNGRSTALAKLLLRLWRSTSAETAPDDPSDANDDAAHQVGHRHGQKRGLGKEQDQIDRHAERDYDQKGTGPHQIDVFETGVAPGADHQKRQKRQQGQPGRGENPPSQR